MVDRSLAVRFGGISGLLYVILFIPAYVVGTPDAPDPGSSSQGVFGYFDAVGSFVFFNGYLPIFAYFFFAWFLGVLYGVLRSAESVPGDDEGGWLSPAALVGG